MPEDASPADGAQQEPRILLDRPQGENALYPANVCRYLVMGYELQLGEPTSADLGSQKAETKVEPVSPWVFAVILFVLSCFAIPSLLLISLLTAANSPSS